MVTGKAAPVGGAFACPGCLTPVPGFNKAFGTFGAVPPFPGFCPTPGIPGYNKAFGTFGAVPPFPGFCPVPGYNPFFGTYPGICKGCI